MTKILKENMRRIHTKNLLREQDDNNFNTPSQFKVTIRENLGGKTALGYVTIPGTSTEYPWVLYYNNGSPVLNVIVNNTFYVVLSELEDEEVSEFMDVDVDELHEAILSALN
jgi:hypothetical protein